MGYPAGLIRYATDNGVRQGWGRREMLARLWRPRVWIYGLLMLGVGLAFVIGLALRSGHRVDVERDRGALARVVEDGMIENSYRLRVGNRTGGTIQVRIGAEGLAALELAGQTTLRIEPYAVATAAVQLRLPPEAARTAGAGAHPLRWRVARTVAGPADTSADGEVVQAASTFYVPR
jgi:polyferredoxin